MFKRVSSLVLVLLIAATPAYAGTPPFSAIFSHTQPSVLTANSFTCLAANTLRKGLLIQNNSAANIMINLNGETLTGIVPTSTNKGIVIAANGTYVSPASNTPTAAVTCYQTSGGTINTISVVEF